MKELPVVRPTVSVDATGDRWLLALGALVAGSTMIGVPCARDVWGTRHCRRAAVPPDGAQHRRRRQPRHLRRAGRRGLPAVPPRRPAPADVPARRLRSTGQPARSAAAGRCCACRCGSAAGSRPRRRWRSSLPRAGDAHRVDGDAALRRVAARCLSGRRRVRLHRAARHLRDAGVPGAPRGPRRGRRGRGAAPIRSRTRASLLAVAVVALPWLSVKYAPVAATLALLGRCGAFAIDPARLSRSARSPSRAGLYLLVHSVSTADGPPTRRATASPRPVSSRSSAPSRTTSAGRGASSACSST